MGWHTKKIRNKQLTYTGRHERTDHSRTHTTLRLHRTHGAVRIRRADLRGKP